MVKEPQNVDFCTTGRQPSEQDFTRISEWIKQDKQRAKRRASRAATEPKAPASRSR